MSCRLCLSTEATFLPIFELSNFELGDIPIALKIAVCVSIPVIPEDIFSKVICSNCFELVDQFYSFRESCLANYVSLQLLSSKEVILGDGVFMENASDIQDEQCYVEESEMPTGLSNLGENVNTIQIDDLTSSYDEDVTLDQTDYEVGDMPVSNNIVEEICENNDDNCEPEESEIVDFVVDVNEGAVMDDELMMMDYSTVKDEVVEQSGSDQGYDESTVFDNDYNDRDSDCDNEEYSAAVDNAAIVDTQKIADFTDVITLEEHDNSIQGKLFVCEICSEIFPNLIALSVHQESCFEELDDEAVMGEIEEAKDCVQTEISPYLVLNLPSATLTNGISRVNEKPNACDICFKVFKASTSLECHKRTHTGERPFTCKVCQQSFSQVGALRCHQFKHTNNYPYQCEICNKGFTRPSDLAKHMRTHTNERPYKCSYCDLRFHQPSGVTVHERTHNGERPYTCNICHMTFSQLSNKYRHLKSHAGDLKPFSCQICYKKFSDKDELDLHRRVHAGDSPRVCPFCCQTFQKQSVLRDHLKRNHTNERPFTCELCNKSFYIAGDLKNHLLVHTGERPHICEYCQQAFTQMSNLKRHQRRCHKPLMQPPPEISLPTNLYDVVDSLDMENMEMLQFDNSEL